MRPSTSLFKISKWTRAIRFVGTDGKVYHGEPLKKGALTWPKWRPGAGNFTDHPKPADALEAKVIEGDILTPDNCRVTDKVVKVDRLLSPLERVSIFRCIGLNYAKHAAETKLKIPPYPVLFIKPSMAKQDPFAPIIVPPICQNEQVDYEAELAVVIGKPCRNVSEQDALNHVLGYTVANDVSARKWQGLNLGSGQWCFSKGFDTFAPIGPALVSSDVITNPNSLGIRTVLNGKVMQNSNTSDMIFNVRKLISFLSQSTTLMPGDVILTGTPEGVGFTRDPPVFLQHGDHVVCSIDEIGELHNTVLFEEKTS
ncbi:hypothetical protein BGW42_001459 [Actinomortierella wolfii]|nr:hypothetical protein BGW42_001459 [Actinomortierella wolfii]